MRFVFCLAAFCIAALINVEAGTHELKDGSIFDLRFEYDDGIYYISSSEHDWFSARNLCLSENTNLVALETLHENTAVTDAFKSRNYTSKDLGFWTSGVDVFTPRNFYWDSTGLTLSETYSYWAPGEPNYFFNGTEEHCINLFKLKNYMWNDYNCDMKLYFICEWHSSRNVVA